MESTATSSHVSSSVVVVCQDLKRVNSYLKSCFLIFPNYNLGHGLMEMAYNEYINEYYAKIGKRGLETIAYRCKAQDELLTQTRQK